MVRRIQRSRVGLAILAWMSLGASTQAQLPSEFSLPGFEIAQQLPAEGKLPADADDPKPPPKRGKVPLPPKPDKAPVLPEPGKDRPWLRFNLPGHTGAIRAMTFTADSQRLCTGGEDKDVHVWRLAPEGKGGRWVHDRTIRWQVGRANNGRIYALAAAKGLGPNKGLLAIAGHGAMGSHGEILLVDPVTGNFKLALTGSHAQVVDSLSFSPDRNTLASMDLSGKVVAWRRNPETGLWVAKTIAPSRQDHRAFSRITMAGNSAVILPAHTGRQRFNGGAMVDTWALEHVNVNTGKRTRLKTDRPLYRDVLAVAASSDGRRVVASDQTGSLFFWDRQAANASSRQRLSSVATCLAIAPNGVTLVTGTTRAILAGQTREPVVTIWNATNAARPTVIHRRRVQHNVRACAISPDGKWFAYNQGNRVVVRQLARPGVAQPKVAGPDAHSQLRVAFAKDKPMYRIAIERRASGNPLGGENGVQKVNQVFDAHKVRLTWDKNPNPKTDLMLPIWYRGDWRIRPVRTATGQSSYYLYRGERRIAKLPLDPLFHGKPSAWCWIPAPDAAPYAVAVGTDGNNQVYVYRLPAGDGPATLQVLRQFRGHGAAITSLGMSRNRRYLASGAMDNTVRVWNLRGIENVGVQLNRWGAKFRINVDAKRLEVAEVDEAGPLYLRGLRKDDVISAIHWFSFEGGASTDHPVVDPKAMLEKLTKLPWDHVVLFDFQRGGKKQPSFQSIPAWRQISSLFVAQNREWSYWTPAGYYDASFEGHKLFGWQFNPEKLDALPTFFLAAQFRKKLERPKVMEKLLEAGSLAGALRVAQGEVPKDVQYAVVQESRTAPRVEILSPITGTKVTGGSVEIDARIWVPEGRRLAPPKAFANGVVAVRQRFVRDEITDQGHYRYYQWTAPLPSDRKILLQVVAATDSETTGFDTVILQRSVIPPRRRPRLFVLACGVNDYFGDAQIQRLDCAVNNATKIAATFEQTTQGPYSTKAMSLLDRNATPSFWRHVTRSYADQLKNKVSPDDLLVVFLSGHGWRDEETSKYYFITAGARAEDVRSGRYSDCMSFEDIAAFSDVPCRKLVILDTCHSGAIGGSRDAAQRQKDLKTALRALQDDVVLTMTASRGQEDAVEEKGRGLGRFTSHLIAAMSGRADNLHGGNQDGTVSLQEAIRYVKAAVADDSAQSEFKQHPTAGPAELLRYVDFPLTQPRAR